MSQALIERLQTSLAAAQEAREGLTKQMTDLHDAAKGESRSTLNDDETAKFGAFKAERDAKSTEITELQGRIVELAEELGRDAAASEQIRKLGLIAPTGGAVVTSEPEVYRPELARSYFLDLYKATRSNDSAAMERLNRNDKIVSDKKRQAGRAISTATGAGGEWVPPLWLEDKFIAYLRPGRIIADKCSKMALPSGTDSINLPKVNTGTATAPQGTQNTAVQVTDLTTASISSPVVTIAGGQVISMQLVEQSPLNIDEIVLKDLASDYARQLDVQVISGTGTGGTLTGLVTAGTAQAWTQTTPSISGTNSFYSAIVHAIVNIYTTRFEAPNAIFMHPRRWGWAMAQADTAGRPLIVPAANQPWNAIGTTLNEVPGGQGLAGAMLGLPVYLDPNIAVNGGAGTNQDSIIVAKIDDVWLMEGNLKAEAFAQTYAQNLSLFVRLYNYVSLQAARYSQSIQVITGTGSVTPAY